MPTADSLIGDESVRRLLACLERAGFNATATKALNLEGLGFAERSVAMRDAFLEDTPDEPDAFAETVKTLASDPESEFAGWLIWPIGQAVSLRMLEAGTEEAFDTGLELLALLTPALTCEAALRPFLEADLDRTLAVALEWTASDDEHVRRLASEGSRPLLPWAPRVRAIMARPDSTTPLLDALYRDPSETVRRSVANHLNDISRAEPGLAVETAARWLAEPDANTDRTVSHALRTLVKQGHGPALRLLGFAGSNDIAVEGPVLASDIVSFGGQLDFMIRLENNGAIPARLAIDYVVHYRKANGSLAPKVFKIRIAELAPGESLELVRSRSFKPISTRRFHPGEHAIEAQVNGVRHGRTSFTLGD